jgi:hypothetical protein
VNVERTPVTQLIVSESADTIKPLLQTELYMHVLLKMLLFKHSYAYIHVDSGISDSVRSKEILEVNGERTEYMFMPRNQKAGQNRNNIFYFSEIPQSSDIRNGSDNCKHAGRN